MESFRGREGNEIRYADAGPKDGTALIWIHGMWNSLEYWDGIWQQLPSSFRHVRMDVPGHGGSAPRKGGSLEQYGAPSHGL